MQTQSDIIDYYENAEIAYKDIWHLNDCMSLHYGFWFKGVKNLKQALIKEIEVLANHVDLKRDDVLLDAGCGVGGSAIFLARQKKCMVHGITLSAKQVESAQQFAQQHGVHNLVSFYQGDYHHTPFNNNFFNITWFVESFGYSNNMESLLKEMFRILKPKGKIIIADGFATKPNFNAKEQFVMDNWLHNWAINSVATVKQIKDALTQSGFINIQIIDYTKEIKKSSFIMYFYAVLALLYGGLCRWFGKRYGSPASVKNTIGAKYQYFALKQKLWKYYVVIAEKP